MFLYDLEFSFWNAKRRFFYNKNANATPNLPCQAIRFGINNQNNHTKKQKKEIPFCHIRSSH
jgi:hypothetical protein